MFKTTMIAAAMLLSVAANAETIKYETMACTMVASVHLASTFDKRASKKQVDNALKEGADGCFTLKKGDIIEVLQRLDSVSLIKVVGSNLPLLVINATYMQSRGM